VKDSVKLDARDYDLTLEGKGRFIHVDSLIQITALEQSLTLTIQAKKAPQTRRLVKLRPDPNPHYSEKWKEFEVGDTPGFTERERQARKAFRTYQTYRFLDKPVPEFRKTTLSGRPITRETFKGHVTLINFWSYGCLGCMAEIPVLNRLHSQYKDDDQVQFLAFFRDSMAFGDHNQRLYKSQMVDPDIAKMAPISAFPIEPKSEKFSFPQVPNSGEITSLFNVWTFPTTMIIDEEGIIRYIQYGMRMELGPKDADYFPEFTFEKLKRKVEQVKR
jgi:thiol-disulfide isomerase/thioredoxin